MRGLGKQVGCGRGRALLLTLGDDPHDLSEGVVDVHISVVVDDVGHGLLQTAGCGLGYPSPETPFCSYLTISNYRCQAHSYTKLSTKNRLIITLNMV